MKPSDFAQRTKEEWKEFFGIEQESSKLTPERIEEDEKRKLKNLVDYANSLLTPYDIIVDIEDWDTSSLWEEYINGEPNMAEWIGDTKRRNEVIAEKIANHNSVKEFCLFVTQYE